MAVGWGKGLTETQSEDLTTGKRQQKCLTKEIQLVEGTVRRYAHTPTRVLLRGESLPLP
jgi:hypothetical protein